MRVRIVNGHDFNGHLHLAVLLSKVQLAELWVFVELCCVVLRYVALRCVVRKCVLRFLAALLCVAVVRRRHVLRGGRSNEYESRIVPWGHKPPRG